MKGWINQKPYFQNCQRLPTWVVTFWTVKLSLISQEAGTKYINLQSTHISQGWCSGLRENASKACTKNIDLKTLWDPWCALCIPSKAGPLSVLGIRGPNMRECWSVWKIFVKLEESILLTWLIVPFLTPPNFELGVREKFLNYFCKKITIKMNLQHIKKK